jgi:Smr domain
MNNELNLRNQYFDSSSHIQQEVEVLLDRFLLPYMNKKNITLRIVVGKGINSNTNINGKNPLRFYTEQYLKSLGFNYRNGSYNEGQEGVIIVEL